MKKRTGWNVKIQKTHGLRFITQNHEEYSSRLPRIFEGRHAEIIHMWTYKFKIHGDMEMPSHYYGFPLQYYTSFFSIQIPVNFTIMPDFDRNKKISNLIFSYFAVNETKINKVSVWMSWALTICEYNKYCNTKFELRI